MRARSRNHGSALLVLAGLLCHAAPAAAQPAVEIQINNTAETRDDYIGYSPTIARIRVSAANGATGTVPVVLRNLNPAVGGQIRFAPFQDPWPAGTTATRESIQLPVLADGSWVQFVVAGQYMRPSTRDRDAVIVARTAGVGGATLGRKELMVRVRKDANTLTREERDLFLNALARLNARGGYAVFQQIHSVVDSQAHSVESHTAYSFLPWHRAMLLAFERALQSIEPAVALPYWRFDEPAPNVFSRDFMGAPPPPTGNTAQFSSTNPLSRWAIRGRQSAIERSPEFAPNKAPTVEGEFATLQRAVFDGFRQMETNSHGPAHVQAAGGGWLGGAQTAVLDPLFFLLHANVDRMWAKWQVETKRFDPASDASYTLQGSAPPGNCRLLGQYSQDTMWPWNGATRPDDPCRPSIAPGGSFPALAPGVFIPPQQPRPHDMIEYRTAAAGLGGAGFSYHRVPFN
jgi:tyrosinase